MFTKKVKKLRQNFSLIELLIVIAIMGILTALILPQFNVAESEAKDTGCDYNNAGTLRFVTMFKSVNGVYPTGYHTGLSDADAVYGIGDGEPGIDPTAANFSECCAAPAVLTDAGDGTTKYLTSMKEAGIVTLAHGDGVAKEISTMPVAVVNADWYEDNDTATAGTTDLSEVLTFQGKTFTEWAAAGTAPDGKDGIIIPLYVASTVNWDTAYIEGDLDGATKESQVGIGLPGKCPWPEDGKLRFYICFFKAYADGSAAKLIGTSCPECGTLHATTF